MAYAEDKDEMEFEDLYSSHKDGIRARITEDEHPYERVLYKGIPVPATWSTRRMGTPHYLESLLNYPYLSPPLYPHPFKEWGPQVP